MHVLATGSLRSVASKDRRRQSGGASCRSTNTTGPVLTSRAVETPSRRTTGGAALSPAGAVTRSCQSPLRHGEQVGDVARQVCRRSARPAWATIPASASSSTALRAAGWLVPRRRWNGSRSDSGAPGGAQNRRLSSRQHQRSRTPRSCRAATSRWSHSSRNAVSSVHECWACRTATSTASRKTSSQLIHAVLRLRCVAGPVVPVSGQPSDVRLGPRREGRG